MADVPADDDGGGSAVVAAAPADVVVVDDLAPLARIKELEAEVYEESVDVLRGAMRFAEVPDAEGVIAGAEGEGTEMPRSWIKQYGSLEKALTMWRLAAMGNMPKGEAPVGFDLAKHVAMGILKARSNDQAGPRELNLTLVAMPSPGELYPTKEVEK